MFHMLRNMIFENLSKHQEHYCYAIIFMLQIYMLSNFKQLSVAYSIIICIKTYVRI